MPAAEIALVVCVGLIAYPYLVYPLLLAAAARLWPRPVLRRPVTDAPPAVSFILAAHNEERRIEGRLHELTALLEARGNPADEIIVVTDGSTDRTAEWAGRCAGRYVRLIELPRRVGKAVALSRGAAEAGNEFLVFADVRQSWAPDALELMLENFADPRVGAVSGDLVIASPAGALAGVGLYWRFEKWLRRQESTVSSQAGVTGAISVCRRRLFEPIPAGTLLDDVYWPLGVALRGYRVVHDSRAVAYDRLPGRTRDEFRRKVRTLAGNFQLVARRPGVLVPWRNPVWVQLVSHKLARLLVPWALAGLLASCVLGDGTLYTVGLGAQLVAYGLAVVGLLCRRGGRLATAAASFLVLNAAAWVAFWVWVSGRAEQSWGRVSYSERTVEPAPQRMHVGA